MKYIFLTLLFFSASFAWAQETSSDKKALKYYADAKKAESERDFDKAITLYEKAADADPSFAEAHQKLSILYGVLRDHQKSKMHVEKAVSLQPKHKSLLMSYAIIASQRLNEGNYAEAKQWCETFFSFSPTQAGYYNQINSCNAVLRTATFALEAINNPVKFSPVELPDPMNAADHQFFPVLTADQGLMIYTVYQEGGNEELYQTSMLDGKWQKPTPIAELNTPYNEGTCSISADGKTMIFTSCEGSGNQRRIMGSCDLFISKKVGGVWTSPENMGAAVNSRYWESQPALSADGKMLFFSSERPGGKGGRDLWMCRQDAKGSWSNAVNLGDKVNTGGHEYSPFIHVNGQNLFFASDGHVGFGKLDLFRADLDSSGVWGNAKNLGYPINNSNDQAGLFITSDGRKGYYSDGIIENGRRVRDKIYVFDIPEEANTPLKIEKVSDVVRGTVFDAKTKAKIGTRIDLVDLATKKIVYSVTSDDKDGDYSMVLTQGAEYALYVNKEGYLFESLSFDYKAKNSSQTIVLDIYLDPIEQGSKVTLNNIFFAFASYQLEDRSLTELDKLVGFMQENGTVSIEIGAHTDNVGSAASNLSLSNNRAQAVVDYLLSKGVPTSRIIAKGYGETQPVGSNDTDEGRALNRRIEFKIL